MTIVRVLLIGADNKKKTVFVNLKEGQNSFGLTNILAANGYSDYKINDYFIYNKANITNL